MQDIDLRLPQPVRRRGRDLFHVHAACGREHHERPLGGRIAQHRRVVLRRDLCPLLHKHRGDRVPRDLHAEDRLCRVMRGPGTVRRQDAADLAAFARRDLGLDHHRRPELRRCVFRLACAPGQAPARDGNPRRVQQRLRRVLLEIHDTWFRMALRPAPTCRTSPSRRRTAPARWACPRGSAPRGG